MLRRSILLVLVGITAASGCRTPQGQGAGIGALGGAMIGAAIDSDNRARGALIGAAAGALVGYVIGDIIDKEEKAAAREAAHRERVVVREVTDRETGERYEIRAVPVVNTRQVTTTVSKWDPATGTWVEESRTVQTVN